MNYKKIDTIPEHHSAIKEYYQGKTPKGFNFDIEVDTHVVPLNTNSRARRMMDLRIQAAAEARAAGRPLGVSLNLRDDVADTVTSIMLRVSAPGKVYRIPVRLNLDGSYTAQNVGGKSLREVVSDMTTHIEARHGYEVTLPAAGRRL